MIYLIIYSLNSRSILPIGYLSFHTFIHPLINLHLSIHLSVHLSMSPSLQLSVYFFQVGINYHFLYISICYMFSHTPIYIYILCRYITYLSPDRVSEFLWLIVRWLICIQLYIYTYILYLTIHYLHHQATPWNSQARPQRRAAISVVPQRLAKERW
jgi:hypothetical protein